MPPVSAFLLPPPEEPDLDEPEDSYYANIRCALLVLLLLAATQAGALVFTRRSLGPANADDSRDSVPVLMCALAQGLTWARAALLLLLLGGWVDALPHAVGAASFVTSWVVTPFAYLYHEAVGVGYGWGASGVVSRAAEAAAVLALLAVLLHGILSLLSTMLPPTLLNLSGMAAPAAAAGGRAGGAELSGSVGAAAGAPSLDQLLCVLAGLLAAVPRCRL